MKSETPSGKRDRRVVIERYTTTYNTFNEPVEAWTTLATVWVSKEDVSDGERMRAAEVSSEITTRFTVLRSTTIADLNPKDRVLYDGKYFDIFSVKEIGRRKSFEITAAARSDGGE